MNVTLLVVQGRPFGKRLTFPPGEYYFGRGSECHVRPNSDWVSREHCLLRVAEDAAYLRDLASRNGTLVNGLLLDGERRLGDGDLVQLGPLVFEVLLDTGAASSSSAVRPGAAPEIKPADEPDSSLQPDEGTDKLPTLPSSKLSGECKKISGERTQ
jgi:pSer/pThr/pTyr-binding forkhead associated (FHA) protein